MYELHYKIEELPLFWRGSRYNDAERIIAGLIDVTLTIEFDRSGDWSITEIDLHAESKGREVLVALKRDEDFDLFDRISHTVEELYTEYVHDRIRQEFFDTPDPDVDYKVDAMREEEMANRMNGLEDAL